MMDNPNLLALAPRVVIATRNPGKLKEFRTLLAPAGWQVIGLSEAAVAKDVPETGSSFAENARLKALGYSMDTGLPVIGDDSGLEVFALGGKPGVRSARYAGPDASDSNRVRKLLLELERHPGNREARFVCALAMAQCGKILCETEGECRGEIATDPRGTQGFGYDPVFVVPESGRTFAEMDEEEKNRCSHRARAVAALLRELGGRCPPRSGGSKLGLASMLDLS